MASRRLLGACLRAGSGLQHHAAAASSSSSAAAAAAEWQSWARRSTEHQEEQQPQQPATFGAHLSLPSSSVALQGLQLRSHSVAPTVARSPSPIAAPLMMARTRGLHTLSGRRTSSVPLGLGPVGLLPGRPLGAGSAAAARSPASGVRTFLTEGQLLGTSFLVATDIMFWSGLIGAVVFRRNLIVMLLATEIVMLACNLNFLFASAYFNDMTGVIMSITITTIAACETAIGLALCVTYFHLRSATDVEVLNFLK